MNDNYEITLKYDEDVDKGFKAYAIAKDSCHMAESGWCETSCDAYRSLAEQCFDAWLYEANRR